MMIKNIFFDFDGVIADSVNVKTEAFYKMYHPYGVEIANKVKLHHLDNGGMSRFKKFAYYHETYLNQTINQEQINILADEFSKLVLDGVVSSPLVPGILDFLENNYKKLNFWVISGTPTEEIRIILKRKNLNSYFIDAFGSPKSKNEWVKSILENYSLNKCETVFIGDAIADFEAANSNDLKFILRETCENFNLFENKKEISLRIKDFINFEQQLAIL